MNARAPLASVWRALDARGRRLAWTFGVAHFAERLALFAVAVAAPNEDRTVVAAAAAALGALTLGRAYAGSVAHAHAQARLHVKVGEALLARDLFRASALEDDDPEAALLDGIDVGARLASGALPGTIADALAAIAVALVLVRTTPPALAGAFAAAVAIGAVVLALFRRVTVAASEEAWAAQRPLVERLVAILSGRLELVANGADGAMRASLEDAARAWQRTVGRFERTTAITSRLPLLFGAGLLAAVFLFRSGGALRDVALAAVALAAALPPFAGAARGLHDVGKLGVRVAPLASLLRATHDDERAGAGPGAAPATPPRAIALDGVAFRYAEAAADVLKNASAELARGTITVLAGPNGCGKSTLLKILLAIEPPREGRLLVDGQPVAATATGGAAAALRAECAYLPQRPFLPERGTVRDAFALLAPDFDEAKAATWLERVGMHEVLRAKSAADPLAVRVGKLSAGQRQRLAIARVGLLDRAVWLLDEPDASLDADGLTRLEAILDEERSRRIVVVAAHADALLRTADRVLRIEAGKLSDEPRPSGTFP